MVSRSSSKVSSSTRNSSKKVVKRRVTAKVSVADLTSPPPSSFAAVGELSHSDDAVIVTPDYLIEDDDRFAQWKNSIVKKAPALC